MRIDFFAKIFIYSNNLSSIDDKVKENLAKKFQGRIEFCQKDFSNEDLNAEFDRVNAELEKFQKSTIGIDLTATWARCLTKSLHLVFSELANATPQWLKELYHTTKQDYGRPEVEIIGLLNNLLAENLVQDQELIVALERASEGEYVNDPVTSAKLYKRLTYTKVSHDAPYMTGDIFVCSPEEYAILITPECDVYDKDKDSVNDYFDLLILSKADILSEFRAPNPSDSNHVRKFNQSVPTKHYLLSFPYENESENENENENLPAVIDFSKALRTCKSSLLLSKKRAYKLNTPYIHQLRQRFAANHSKFGVSANNKSFVELNLMSLKEEKDKKSKKETS